MVQKLATAWLKGAKGVSVSVNTVDADTLPAPWHVSTTVRFFTNDGSDREKINELAKQLAALQKLDDKKFWCVTRRPPSVPRPRRRARHATRLAQASAGIAKAVVGSRSPAPDR